MSVLSVTSPQGLAPMASSPQRIDPFPLCNSMKLLKVKYGELKHLGHSVKGDSGPGISLIYQKKKKRRRKIEKRGDVEEEGGEERTEGGE